MEKIKFSNGSTFDITVNGVRSTDEKLTIGLVASDTNIVEIEDLITAKDNVNRIELLSENEEVLKIYSGYTVLTSIEKKKDIIISVTIEEATEEGGEPTEVINKSDVIYVSLRKENETEVRLASLEETVDVLVMSALM